MTLDLRWRNVVMEKLAAFWLRHVERLLRCLYFWTIAFRISPFFIAQLAAWVCHSPIFHFYERLPFANVPYEAAILGIFQLHKEISVAFQASTHFVTASYQCIFLFWCGKMLCNFVSRQMFLLLWRLRKSWDEKWVEKFDEKWERKRWS